MICFVWAGGHSKRLSFEGTNLLPESVKTIVYVRLTTNSLIYGILPNVQCTYD